MIELKKEFSKKQKSFRQIFQNDELFIYEVTFKKADGTNGVFYEAFKSTVRKADIYHNDEYIVYPSDESFGIWAWCYSSKEHLLSNLSKHFSKETIEDVRKSVKC